MRNSKHLFIGLIIGLIEVMLGGSFLCQELMEQGYIARPIPLPQCRFIPPPETTSYVPPSTVFGSKPAHPALFFTRVPGGLCVQDSPVLLGVSHDAVIGLYATAVGAHAHAPRPGWCR